MTDHILLQGLSFFGYHGVRPEEKRLGQRFTIDLVLGLNLAPAGRADDLDLTVNYSDAYRVVQAVVEGPSRDTIEAVAEALAAALLERFARLESVGVRVGKPGAPIATPQLGLVAVQISRRREPARGE